jgi:RNA polymerase sigma-70 factor (ECF subfamily)
MAFADTLSRSRQGDAAAQEELFGRWRPLLRLQARKLLGPDLSARVDPSDVVQDTLLQASQDLEKFRGSTQGEWVAWLQVMVAGQAAKVRRHHGAGRRDVGRDESGWESVLPDQQPAVVDHVIDAEDAGRLAAAIENLSDPLREVVVRRLVDRQPTAAVAETLGRTPKAVRSLLAEALRRLRETLRTA